MNTIKKRNRIVLCLCSILVMFASIFAFIPFNKQPQIVKADSVISDYKYNGSNFTSNTTFTNGNFSYNILKYPYGTSYNTSYGITFTNNIDGSFTLNGQQSSTTSNSVHFLYLRSDDDFKLLPGTYSISLTSISSVSGISLVFSDGSNYYVIGLNNGVRTFTISDEKSFDVYLQVSRESTTIFDNLIICPMIVEGSANLPFKPYSNTTSVNYKFDFRILNTIPTNAVELQYNLGYVITDNFGYNYSIVGYENGSNVIDFSHTSYYPYIFLPTCFFRYCYRYNNGVFDYNYYIPMYFAFDYIESYTSNVPFNGNVSYIVFGSYLDSASYFHTDSYQFYQEATIDFINNGKYNFVGYVDTNGNTFNIIIPLDTSVSSSYFNFRKYFFNSESVGSSYYNDGYRVGFSNGEDKGYSDGYLSGKDDGYWLGYQSAIDNDKYTFTSLISSVIDVPVQAFTSLFNFEILGVNLSGFFLGLLTCCIVIGVIRLIL